jgi:pilus assembly protein CpaB
MTRIRLFLVLALALTAGGGLAYGTYNYLQNVPVKTVSIPTRPVVVAAADLDLGAELGREDLRMVEWPANAAPQGAFADASEVVGRGLVMPVIQNEPILPVKLAAKGAGAGLPPVIPDGMRALSVRVNEVIGVAGYVLPGTHVDVVATASPTDQHGDTTSKVVMSNVQVLAAGTKIDRDTNNGKPMPVSVVTLLVNPEEAERLTLASTEGKIQLALRNPLDKTAPATPGVKPAVLFGAAKPAPKAAPARTAGSRTPAPEPAQPDPPPSVEIIRGDQRAREVVR